MSTGIGEHKQGAAGMLARRQERQGTMRWLVALLMIVALVVLVGGLQGAEKADLGYFQVPHTPAAPKIDGQLDEGAWKSAVVLTGFSTLSRAPAQADHQTQVLVMYDKDNLYLAFNSVLVGKPPRASKTERDSAVYEDDSIEIMIAPPGLKEGQFYQMVANAKGAVFDYFHGGSGVEWNANWNLATYIWDFEWVSEISVPLVNLGVEDPTQGPWRFNFCRSYEQSTAWSNPGSSNKGYLNYDRFAWADFAEGIPLTTIKSLEGLGDGNIAVRVELSNPTPQQKAVYADAYLISDDPAQGHKRMSGGALLLPGTQQVLVLREQIKDKSFQRLKLEITEGGRTIYRSVNPFQLVNIDSVVVAATPDMNVLKCELDLSRVESDAERFDVRIQMRDADGVVRQRIELAGVGKNEKQVLSRNIRELATGPYNCIIEILEPDSGEVLETAAQPFEKRPTPQWYEVGRTLGTAECVLPPWTPVVVDKNIVKVWGRDHVLGERGDFLFKDVTSQEQSLLDGPMALCVKSEGRLQTAQLVQRSAVSGKATAAQWRDTYELGSLTAVCDLTVEYDGMIKVEMTLTPGEQGEEMESLYLDIPLKGPYSQYCNYSCNYYGSDFSGAVGETAVHMGFQNYVWAGGNERGLMWFAEGPLNWNYQGEPIHVRREGIRVDFINVPTSLVGPAKIVFGLMATPVKKATADRYALNKMPEQMWCANFTEGDQSNKLMSQLNVIWYSEGRTDEGRYVNNEDDGSFTTPLAKDTRVLKNAVDRPGNADRRNVFYQYFSGTGPMAVDFDKYGRLWQRMPKREWDYNVGAHPEKHIVVQTCYNSSFADYMLYGIKHLVEESGIDGIYFDGSGGPSECENAWHGCSAYMDARGKAVSMTPVFATREFHKRLATMLYELRGDRAFVVCHLSGTIGLPILSFTQAYLDGESPGRASAMGGPKTTELTNFDYWRSHAVDGAAGLAPVFLVYTGLDAAIYRGYLTMILPHGIPIYALGDVLVDPQLRLTTAILRAQNYVGLDQADFWGYWQNSDRVTLTPSHADVVCSYYVNRNDTDKVMVIVSNRSKQLQNLVLQLDRGAFGELAGKTFYSVSDDFEGRIDEANQVKLTVGAEDFICAVIVSSDINNELLQHPGQLENGTLKVENF